MLRKTIWITLLFLLLSFVLIACGGGAADTDTTVDTEPAADVEPAADTEPAADVEEEEMAEPAEKARIRIFVGLGTGTDPDQIGAQEALADEFNATHDSIELEFLIVPNEESGERLLAMVSGGDAPELVGPGGVDVAGTYFDLLADVSPFVEAQGIDLSDFYGAAVDLYQYPDKMVGLPLGMFPSFIFYNKDLFDAAGLDYPPTDYGDTNWTLDALRDMAMELTLDVNGNNANSPDFDPDNVAQWGYDDSWTDLRGWMTHFDPPGKGRPLSEDLQTSLVDSAEYQYGLEWLNNAVWRDHFMADYTGQDAFYAVADDPFGSQMTAMFYSHTWFMPEGLVDLPFEYDFAVEPFNQKDTRVARIHADTFYMPKDANHKEEAFEVMQWLTSPEHIIDVCLIYGCLPARLSVQDDFLELFQARYGEHNYDVIFGAIEYLDNPHHESWMPEVERVGEVLQAELLDRVYTEPVDDPDALLEEVDANVQAIIDEYWANQ
jgi:multiple sugar transport system substrate-binding protein